MNVEVYRGACACGWKAPGTRNYAFLAQADAKQHREEAHAAPRIYAVVENLF